MNKNLLLKELLDSEIVLVDGGAKGGTKELLKLAPFTTVHAFEPHPAEVELLRKNSSLQNKFSKYVIHDVALSDKEGSVDFNLMNNSSMSSLLDPDFEKYHLHFGMMHGFPEWKNNIIVNEKVKVKASTLDSFTNENNIPQIDFLKLDTQGNELKILNGAKNLLENHLISVIKSEVAFVPVYKRQCLFSDVDIFLRQHEMQFVDCLFYENTIYRKAKNQNHSLLKDAGRYSSGGDAVYIINIEKVSLEKRKETALKTGMILAELNYKSIAFDFLHHHANLDETIAINLIRVLSSRNLQLRFKQVIKDWCPPKILYMLRNIF
jgi:FkbM family methyltransferase